MSICLVEDVSDDTYVLAGLDITMTPASPWLGQQVCCQMSGHLNESVDLTRVTCKVIMKFGPVKMLERTYALPDLLNGVGAGLSGDLRPPAGSWRQTWIFRLPETVPVAEHRILLRARTGTGKGFFALNIAVNFSRAFYPAATSGSAGSRLFHGACCP